MNIDKIKRRFFSSKKDKFAWQLLVSVLILPFIIVLSFYSRNYLGLPLLPLILIAGAVAVLTGLLFTAVWYLSRQNLSALFSVILFHVGWLTYKYFTPWLEARVLGEYAVYFALFILALLFIGNYIFQLSILQTGRRFRAIVLLASSLLLLFMIIKVINVRIQILKYHDNIPNAWLPGKINLSLPSPNIYWFHCDGMLSFAMFEKYYHNPQSEFNDFLQKNGFKVNHHAAFEAAHRTCYAVPSMMCPHFYDSFLQPFFSSHEKSMNYVDHISAQDEYLISWYRLFHNEMLMTFEKKGYHVSIVPNVPNIYLYYFNSQNNNTKNKIILRNSKFESFIREILGNNPLSKFISQSHTRIFSNLSAWNNTDLFFPNAIPPECQLSNWTPQEYEQVYGKTKFSADFRIHSSYCPGEIMAMQKSPTPHFVIFNQIGSHFPYIYNRQGEQIRVALLENPPQYYYEQHLLVADFLQENIRQILLQDPDAVIILQGDHGLHGTLPKEFKSYFGDNYSCIELWNGVISAVRIPEKYCNGSEQEMLKTPLNISRYLINRFVGAQNYRYLNQ